MEPRLHKLPFPSDSSFLYSFYQAGLRRGREQTGFKEVFFTFSKDNLKINNSMKLFGQFKYPVTFTLLFFFANCSQTKTSSSEKNNLEQTYFTVDDFKSVEKIDAHVHVNTDQTPLIQQAEEDNFRLLTINWDDANDPPPMEVQQKFAIQQLNAFPDRIAYATTFSIRNFNNADWQEQTIAYLKNSFSQGAIAVKIYKVIGMSLRDKNGKLVMIDDPRFDGVIDFIVENNIPVVGHLGEPKNCWLPVEKMTIKGDKIYFGEHPEYHMHLHPEFPTYEAQIVARDNMLEKHTDLKFVGVHLGSLEWSVSELAKRLDKFPNMAVDMAARISHLQYQAKTNRQEVRDFCMKYQDRLLYATDIGVNGTENPVALKKHAHDIWVNDWKFFTTDEMMQASEVEGEFKGLKLPREVVDKIYRKNADKWLPGINKKQ